MGEKKHKESKKTWTKILVVVACLAFVVLMVLSGMGSGWLTAFTSVKPGDTVVLDYTLMDPSAHPIVTTDQQIFTQSKNAGSPILLSRQISLQANQSLLKPVYPIQVSTDGRSWDKQQFALFDIEFNALSKGIVGMKVNEQKRISLGSNLSMTQFWSVEKLRLNKVNLSDFTIGDSLKMAVSDNPDVSADNESAFNYQRTVEVTNKSADGITINFGIPFADVRVVSINKV